MTNLNQTDTLYLFVPRTPTVSELELDQAYEVAETLIDLSVHDNGMTKVVTGFDLERGLVRIVMPAIGPCLLLME
jgi:hypothetical protein